MSQDAYYDDPGDFDGEGGGGGLPGFVTDPKGVIKRRWLWMVLVTIAGLATSVFYVQTRVPEYQARATVLVASQRISERFVQSTVESDQLEKVSAILGELLSRRKLTALIVEHDLFPVVEGVESLTMEEKTGIIRSAIAIGPDRSNQANSDDSSATVFEILFTHGSADKAAAVANDLATSFTDIHLRMRSRQARITTEFLRRELEKTEEELAGQERSITQFKQQFRGSLPSELSTSIGRLDRLQSQRQSLALQIASAESRLATLAATGSDVQQNSPMALLRDLRMRYKEQSAVFTDDHPNIVSLRNQIDGLEARIREEGGFTQQGTSPAADAARIELAELRRQLQATVSEFDRLDGLVALVPQREEELASMEARAVILREKHREFLRKVNQAELSEAVESAQQGERASVLDEAIPPWQPTSSPLKVVAVLLVGTLGGAMGLAILLEILDSVIVGEAEIERNYRIPVLGSVSKLG